MEQRRFLVFFLISMAIWMAWINLAVPRLFPEFNKPPKPVATLDDPSLRDDGPVDALQPVNRESEPDVTNDKIVENNLPKHPALTLLLGPSDPDVDQPGHLNDQLDEYLVAASLSSQGASIEYVELTDKKQYPAFGHRGQRVRVIGNDSRTPLKTFALTCPQIDKQLQNSSIDRVAWEVVPESDPKTADRAVTFRFVSPDGRWELRKHFELKQLTLSDIGKPRYRDTLVDGYEIKLTITARNLMAQDQQLSYSLQGPVGVPLEDAENSYKYRDIRLGFVREDGPSIDETKLSAAETVKKAKANKTEIWKRKLKYIGEDSWQFAP